MGLAFACSERTETANTKQILQADNSDLGSHTHVHPHFFLTVYLSRHIQYKSALSLPTLYSVTYKSPESASAMLWLTVPRLTTTPSYTLGITSNPVSIPSASRMNQT